jgi:hypothetical protein
VALFQPSGAVNRPSLSLSDDEIATAIRYITEGAHAIRSTLPAGANEVQITLALVGEMRAARSRDQNYLVEFFYEHQKLARRRGRTVIAGRLDIAFKFASQFGDEDAALVCECKRVSADSKELSRRYVSEGVDRFVMAQYASGHGHGIMLGYVLRNPAVDVVTAVSSYIQKGYGGTMKSWPSASRFRAAAILEGTLRQKPPRRIITMLHVFVEMLEAYKAPRSLKAAAKGAKPRGRKGQTARSTAPSGNPTGASAKRRRTP